MLVPAGRGESELREKGSRFLGVVERTRSEAQARSLVESLDQEHADATHVCFAWRLEGPDRTRCSDAGEPHGTAGPPLLDSLAEEDLLQATVVVVRWYGGTKLGKGGLARAYRETARGAVASAGRRRIIPRRSLAFRVPVAVAGRVPTLAAACRARLTREDWSDRSVRFRLEVPQDREDELRQALRDGTSGKVTFE